MVKVRKFSEKNSLIKNSKITEVIKEAKIKTIKHKIVFLLNVASNVF